MHWKIERDRNYRKLFPILGEKGIIDAGFFYDKSEHDVDFYDTLDIHCNPIQRLKAEYKKHKNHQPAILISTGAFNPIHDGHVDMMLSAKIALERDGYHVIGGFFSPDHGSYIEEKLGPEALKIQDRIELIRKAIKPHPWLEVDSWPGIFHHTSINFTDIIDRMRLYLFEKFRISAPIFFVCGGDNARFAKTFLIRGHCVIVNRPGYENQVMKTLNEIDRYNQKYVSEIQGTHLRILTASNENANSSTDVRRNWKHELKEKELFLRIDSENREEEQPFIDIISKYFTKVNYLDIRQQIQDFCHDKYEPENTISLDPFVSADHNLGISRLYDFFGTRRAIQHFCKRPGTESIDKQLAKIPKGEYVLFDDDICTGSTIQEATRLLENQGSEILTSVSLTRSNCDQEILDVRDFMYKSKKGGLVIQGFNYEPKRFIYVYPFVCPHTRASIQKPMEFSIEIWIENYKYWQKRSSKRAAECMTEINRLAEFIM